MGQIRRVCASVAGAAAMAVALMGSAATPATAATAATARSGGWTPYTAPTYTVVTSARSTCGFDVREKVLDQGEEFRTLATYPDGAPRLQEWRGALTVRLRNLTTGAAVVRDLGGTGVYVLNHDGTPASLTSEEGPFGATLPPGSTPQTGIVVLSGAGTTVAFHADGSRSYVFGPRGTVENLCATLRDAR